jgi:hypothetical protein
MSLRFASEFPARKHSHPKPRATSQETQSELSVYLFPSAPAASSNSGSQLDQSVFRPRLESATSNSSAWTLPEGSQTPQEGDISSLCSFTDEEEFFDVISPEVRDRRPLQIWTAPLPPDINIPMNGIRMRLHDPAAQAPLHTISDASLSDDGSSVRGTTYDDRTAVPSPVTSQGWLMDLIAKWIGFDRDTLALVYPSISPEAPGPPVSLDNDSVLVACTQRLGKLLTFESQEAHGGEVRKGLRSLSNVDS